MVRPIEATPTLNREESIKFLRNMIKVQNRKKPTKIEKFYIDCIRANWGPKKKH